MADTAIGGSDGRVPNAIGEARNGSEYQGDLAPEKLTP